VGRSIVDLNRRSLEMDESTPGPLKIDRWGKVLDPAGRPFMVHGACQPDRKWAWIEPDLPRHVEARANARRLVALWNACAGLSTAMLETVGDADPWDRLVVLGWHASSVAREICEPKES
jgi:hypothetical protein